MSRATSPPAAPAPLCTITVGLCASAKKHQQSFDALREAGKLHNERVMQLRSLSAAAAAAKAAPHDSQQQQQGECASITSTTRSHRASRGILDNITAHSGRSRATAADSPSRSVVNSCLFRFVNLNYDAVRHRIVVCVNPDIKGEHPAGASPSGVVPGGSGSNAAGTGSGGSKPKTRRTSRDGEPGNAEDSATDAGEASQASLSDEVDVVFHKVATFGTASAIRALERWCKLAQKRRRRLRKPPLVVVDPLEKVQLLMTRSMLYKLLDNTGEDGQPVALIPRTFMWESAGTPTTGASRRRADQRGGAGSAATPLGIHSFSVMGEEQTTEPRANGTAAGRWWIAKPDEGTGPAFTHHLVMWRTRNTADVTVPAAVQAALPTESRRFIVQELYVYALPVVLKVYCVGPHIYVKVNPTVNLLTHLWEHTRGSTVVDVPVMMDSQEKGFFSAVTSTSPTPSQPALSTTASGADYGYAAPGAPNTLVPAVAPPSPNPMTASGTPPHDTPLGATTDPHVIAWETMVAPGERWDSFLAPGTPAYTAISKLAQALSGYAGIGLSLYGFDIVLVPQNLAHAYQRKGTRGIGRTEGATVRYDVALPTPAKAADARVSADTSTRSLAGISGAPAPNAVPLPFRASDMFDSATGAPTALLLDSIPVVIDVNYFPGYKGVAEAGQHMLELIALRTTHAQSSVTGAGAGGTRHADAKKWRCDVA